MFGKRKRVPALPSDEPVIAAEGTMIAPPRALTPGSGEKGLTPHERERRRAVLCATVRKYLPEFVKAVLTSKVDVLVLHQDAFAAGYADDEFVLLGMAIKFAGLYGREVIISGTNGETFDKPK